MEARLLTQLEMVRQRPGMYIGDTDDTTGALNMLLEVFANSFDQYLAGRCTRIAVEVAADGAITIADDGPGLSADAAELRARVAAE